MNDFEQMILQNLKYSYSSANTFLNCPLSFKYSYIVVENRISNYYSDYGKFLHHVLERYFKGELQKEELSEYYTKNYKSSIKHSAPSSPPGLAKKYYYDGLEFFKTFEFNRDEWEFLGIEEKLETTFKSIRITVIPDLILKNKESGVITLVDFKTANLFHNDKVDKKKLEEIKKQMNLYVYFVWYIKQIEISKIEIWAIRNQKTISFDYDPVAGAETLDWFLETIEKIKSETEWKGNNKNLYFCQQLCSFYSLPCKQFS